MLNNKSIVLIGLASIDSDVVDTTLPLFGPYSISGRAVVIHLAKDMSRWVCANVESVGVKLLTAVAIFRYPLGGNRLVFHIYF